MSTTDIVKADLTAHPDSSINDIMARTNLSRSTVHYSLGALPVVVQPYWPRLYRLVEHASNGASVEAKEIDPKKAGPLWQSKRAELGAQIAKFDLDIATYEVAIKSFEAITASMLGILSALQEVGDVPEWREEIGL